MENRLSILLMCTVGIIIILIMLIPSVPKVFAKEIVVIETKIEFVEVPVLTEVEVPVEVEYSRIDFTDDEVELLEYLIMAEGGICSMPTQIALADVVINRILSDSYPDTLEDVVFQPYQFSVTFDGSLYRELPTQQVREAVNVAIHSYDITDGALSFLNVDLAIQQGYVSNVNNMLRYNDVVFEADDVTFLKPKN